MSIEALCSEVTDAECGCHGGNGYDCTCGQPCQRCSVLDAAITAARKEEREACVAEAATVLGAMEQARSEASGGGAPTIFALYCAKADTAREIALRLRARREGGR